MSRAEARGGTNAPRRCGDNVSETPGERGSAEMSDEGKFDFGLPSAELTPREQEVYDLVIYSHTSREIGEIMGVKERTVNLYRGRICEKLGISGRNAIQRHAAKRGED